VRVIAGSARGRRIDAPPGRDTRPITDRAKEGIFNMLGSLDADGGPVIDATVVDLFAGSGSFGIECLSRGAERVVFVERDRTAARTLERNLTTLGFDDRARLVVAPVASALPGLPHADLAFCDPPYADDPWVDLLGSLQADVLVGHAEHEIELTDRWLEVRRRHYGRARIVIARRAETVEAQDGGVSQDGRSDE
jgi:16S rRNA (guanine966-N2)-methyltransferase